MRCDQIETLLSGYIDNMLPQQQRQRVELHVAECETCARELASLQHIRDDLRMMRMDDDADPTVEEMDRIRAGVFERGFGWGGWAMLVGGLLVLAGYALYEFITAPTEHAVIKVAVLAVFGGFAFLLGNKLAERRREYKTDRYKDVVR